MIGTGPEIDGRVGMIFVDIALEIILFVFVVLNLLGYYLATLRLMRARYRRFDAPDRSDRLEYDKPIHSLTNLRRAHLCILLISVSPIFIQLFVSIAGSWVPTFVIGTLTLISMLITLYLRKVQKDIDLEYDLPT